MAPSVPLPQASRPARWTATTGLADCGNWDVSASWIDRHGAVSGIYVAKLKRLDTGGASHIVFVVRDDARQADVVVQTSDTTWQAYNQYGGGSLYCDGPVSNAGTVYGVRRPRDQGELQPPVRHPRARSPELPVQRRIPDGAVARGQRLRRQVHRRRRHRARCRPILLGAKKPKAFVASATTSTWSAGQRATVEAARDAGVSLAFFSGNEIYWKTRFEPSADGTARRTARSSATRTRSAA